MKKEKKKEKEISLNGNKVFVMNDNFEGAFRLFKRKIKKSGVIQDCRNKEFYIKPSEKRKIALDKAKKRQYKTHMENVL
jgi:small subunit ribosomal protein S21